jgi:hypothetical protein
VAAYKQKAIEIGRVKKLVRARDGQKCTGCGMSSADHVDAYGRDLDVHRLTPGSLYTLEGCVTMCKACHAPQPRRKKGATDLANGCALFLRIDEEVAIALHNFIQSREVPVTNQAVAVAAIKRFLKDLGFYPPPPRPKS